MAPFSSDAQRRFLFAKHPQIARRWAAEEKKAPPIGPAMEFPALRARGLVGISDQVIREHLALYGSLCAELAALDAQRSAPWRPPAGMAPGMLHELLRRRVCDLDLEIAGELKEAVDQVEGELQDKGIAWRPLWYIGDSDFWTADHATSINLPWFLASPELWATVNENYLRYSREDVVRILRHEVGHALGYAFLLYERTPWIRAFGDMGAPYRDDFTPDPALDADFVVNVERNGSAPLAHYAQKHPDEDWAETFAVWLDEGSRWREVYADRPVALAKLESVQELIVDLGLAYGPAPNRRVGRRVSYRTLDFTIGEYLGVRTTLDPADAALRREPTVYDAVVLHEAYFGGLLRDGGGTTPGPRFQALVDTAGGFDVWATRLREVAQASGGWALAVWDRRDGRIRNVLVDGHDRGVPAGCDILLALDLFEHAYAGDVGTRKDIYVAAWWRNIDWLTVEARAMRACPPPAPPEVIPAGTISSSIPLPVAPPPLLQLPGPPPAATTATGLAYPTDDDGDPEPII